MFCITSPPVYLAYHALHATIVFIAHVCTRGSSKAVRTNACCVDNPSRAFDFGMSKVILDGVLMIPRTCSFTKDSSLACTKYGVGNILDTVAFLFLF